MLVEFRLAKQIKLHWCNICYIVGSLLCFPVLFVLCLLLSDFNIHLRQVNGVNGGDIVFVRCVSVCACAQRTGQSDQGRVKLLSCCVSAANTFLLFPSGEWRVMCYQKTFRNQNNLNCDRIFRAKRQLSLIPLNRTAALPSSAEQLNSPQFKTVKAAEFKFGMHVSRDSPDMTPFEKGASVEIHLTEICTHASAF